MRHFKKTLGPSFLTLGLAFLVIGWVQQGLTLSFESGLFNLGLIFSLSGAVATVLERRAEQPEQS